MPGFLRQSTASQSRALGPFLDDTDFKTTKTGLTIANTDIKLVVNGGASANKNSGGGTHRVNGVYGVTFDATDTATVGELEVSCLMAGALIVFDKFTVVTAAVYDRDYAAAATGIVGTAQTGDAFARLGAAGAGLTALGDARIANLDAAISSRSTYAGGDTSGVTTLLARLSAARAGYLDNLSAGAVALEASLQALIATVGALNNLSSANVRSAVGLASANLDTQLLAIAGYIDTEVAAIKAKTDLIPAAPAAVGDIPTALQNADALLKRDLSAVTGEAARSPLNALRFTRNKFTIAGGTLTVYKEDDTTPAWTAAITQTAGNPVSASDPA